MRGELRLHSAIRFALHNLADFLLRLLFRFHLRLLLLVSRLHERNIIYLPTKRKRIAQNFKVFFSILLITLQRASPVKLDPQQFPQLLFINGIHLIPLPHVIHGGMQEAECLHDLIVCHRVKLLA